MTQLDEVLQFVRTGHAETRDLIIRELHAARRREDEVAAESFRIGESVRFQPPDNQGQPVEGRIARVGRSRVILAVSNERGLRLLRLRPVGVGTTFTLWVPKQDNGVKHWL